jgi:hypothetical protein
VDGPVAVDTERTDGRGSSSVNAPKQVNFSVLNVAPNKTSVGFIQLQDPQTARCNSAT